MNFVEEAYQVKKLKKARKIPPPPDLPSNNR